MCSNQPIEKTRAVCNCGAHFPECDLEEALEHGRPKLVILMNGEYYVQSFGHRWTYIHDAWKNLIFDYKEKKDKKQV